MKPTRPPARVAPWRSTLPRSRMLPFALALCLLSPPSPARGAEPGPVEVEEATVADLRDSMAAGRTTSRAIVQAYLDRIARLDPSLRSILELNPDALSIADGLDGERRKGATRGPLHGIPVLLKDNVSTGDRMETTAGSLALSGSRAPRDAFLVARLRAAGAVILGKANLSEWANIRSTHSSSGWSARGGQTRNPYALDRSPCGSSSGTAAAVAASLVTVGVGTETDGSVVCPSGATGLVGLKPTVGLVSRSGIVPISATQDTAGPMARTVADAAALLGALTGVDPADPASPGSGGKASTDYARFLDPEGLRGARIGVVRKGVYGASPPADRIFDAAVAEMRRRGAVVVDPADIPHLGEYDDAELEVLLYELKAGLDAFLPEWAPGAKVRSLADVIAFDEAHAAEEMPFFGQELFIKAQAKGPLTDAAYRKALARCRRLSREKGLDTVFAKHRLDALVAPTGGPAWTIDLVTGDHFVQSSSTPAAVAGYPSITVPAGQAFGLPVGVSFIGKPWSEGTLLRLAYAFEQATRARRPPALRTTADLSGR
jgi:amidase